MKKHFILLIFLILLTKNLNAKSKYMIKFGGNVSNFRGEETVLNTGITLGLGREWLIFNNATIAGEILYSQKEGILKDKTIGIYFYDYWGLAFDIHCDVRYVEIPIVFNYYLMTYKSINLRLYAGPSLSVGIQDKSNKKMLYVVNNFDNSVKFDYVYAQEPGWWYLSRSSGFNINIGIGICLSLFSLDFRYSRSFYDIDTVTLVNIHEKLDTLYLLLGFKL